MLEEKLKGVKVGVVGVAVALAGAAALYCLPAARVPVRTIAGVPLNSNVSCCSLLRCQEEGYDICSNDDLEEDDGVVYQNCSCKHNHPVSSGHTTTSSGNDHDRGYGMGDRDNHGGTHRECQH